MQNRQLERLRQIVVGARLKSLQHVLRAAARGQHQHRHELPGAPQARPRPRSPSMPGSITSRMTRSKRAGSASELRQRRFSRVDHVDVVLLGLEVEPQAVGEVLLVFDDQDPAHRGGDERQLHGERAAAAGPVALGEHLAAVARDHRADDEQAQAGAFDARRDRAGNPVEALEDPLAARSPRCRRPDRARAAWRAPLRAARAPPPPAPADPST